MIESNGSFEDLIENIADVLLNTYFNYVRNPDMREDLRQEAYLKAYLLMQGGGYKPTQNLRNYLFTGMRNAMSNYLYSDRKNTFPELETDYYVTEIDEGYAKESLPFKDIERVCLKYRIFGDYTGITVNRLRELGLVINAPTLTIIENPLDIIEDAIVGEIIWQI